MTNTPRYDHDCGRCTFLGRDGAHDVYVCPQSGWPTVILRYGSDGPEYHSGRHLVDRLPPPMGDQAADLMSTMRESE